MTSTHTDPPGLVKVTVYLTDRSMLALGDTAKLNGDTMTNTLNRALQLYALLELERATDAELWLVRTVEVRRSWWVRLLAVFGWRPAQRRDVQRLEWRKP